MIIKAPPHTHTPHTHTPTHPPHPHTHTHTHPHTHKTQSLYWFQTNWTYHFFSVLFQWEKFRLALWKLVSKTRAKIQEKNAWLLCGRVSASLNANLLPDFLFPNSRFSTENIVAFVQVRVFVSSRIRQYYMPSISQWLRIRCHLYVWHRYTLKNNCFHISFIASLAQSCVAVRFCFVLFF